MTFKNIKLFEICGIPTFLSPSLIAFVGFLSFLCMLEESGVWNAIVMGCMVLSIFALAYSLITIHEYGHSLTAKYLGYGKRTTITLYPFAGLARIDGDWHKNPAHEFWITIMGPFTNLVMALLALPLVMFWPTNSIFVMLFEFNVILLAFNITPVYPMDGGRIMRSWLTSFFNLDCIRSTFWAAMLTTCFLFVLVPVFWIYDYSIASILIAIISIAGWMEWVSLKRQNEAADEDEIDEKKRTVIFNRAIELYPNNEEEQDNFVNTILEVDKFVDLMVVQILQKHNVDKNSDEASMNACIKKVYQAFAYMYEMEESERRQWNLRFTLASSAEDGGASKEKLMQEFLLKVES